MKRKVWFVKEIILQQIENNWSSASVNSYVNTNNSSISYDKDVVLMPRKSFIDPSKFCHQKDTISMISSVSSCTESSKSKMGARVSVEPKNSSLYSKRKCDLIYEALYPNFGVPFESDTQPWNQSQCDTLLSSYRISQANQKEEKFEAPAKSKVVKINKKNVVYAGKTNKAKLLRESLNISPRLNFGKTINITEIKAMQFL